MTKTEWHVMFNKMRYILLSRVHSMVAFRRWCITKKKQKKTDKTQFTCGDLSKKFNGHQDEMLNRMKFVTVAMAVCLDGKWTNIVA